MGIKQMGVSGGTALIALCLPLFAAALGGWRPALSSRAVLAMPRFWRLALAVFLSLVSLDK